ncbi:MAG TPA: ATP-binding protein, partial [Acidobacteriota bacterium]|nr:ATP-binding protein [Acidobacteriota bacterium]
LRDDGLGMTEEDFEERWLTLGTESKIKGGRLAPPPRDKGKKRRPIIGEKGIGRLAIAVIGPQVLVLTRAKRDGALHDLVACFVHWGLFELPGINLDQVEFPVRTFPGGTLPGQSDVEELIEEVRRNVQELVEGKEIKRTSVKHILEDLDNCRIDPAGMAGFLGQPTLREDGHGTHFYILPASDILAADIEIDLAGKEASDLRRLLLGFTNTMTPNTPPPPITAAFRYWPTEEQPKELIGPREFFAPEEFEMADHHIKGRFDEFGQFKGTVTVYDQKPVEHVVSWPRALGKPTACGPFSINVAYVHGLARQSRIPPEEHARLIARLELFGGLYIYRDGIRVLPYGDADVDFLEFEKRRTKGAAYYFFSYRRMFGAIEVTREENSGLTEKAGREGFQQNKAYKEFRAMLMNFFVQIAADFFREEGEYADAYYSRRTEIEIGEKALKEHEQQSGKERRAFASRLDRAFARVNSGEPAREVSELFESLEEQVHTLVTQRLPPPDETDLLEIEVYATRQLEKLRGSYQLEKPSGVGLTRELKRDWGAYLAELERLDKEVFSPTRERIAEIVSEGAREAKLALDRRMRVKRLLDEITATSQQSVQEEAAEVEEVLNGVRDSVVKLARQALADMQSAAEQVEMELGQLELPEMDQEEIDAFRHRWENKFSEMAVRHQWVLAYICSQLQNIDVHYDEDGHLIGNAETTAALEEEMLALRERVEMDLQLTQLGMAIEVISHEFGSSIKAVRHDLRRLKGWADINPELQNLYRGLRTSFDHLDGYLTLFTPLYRRLYREETEIRGSEIAGFLQKLFEERMRRHQVELIPTKAFREKTIVGFPSTFYPVFINLVDNAIFWLQDQLPPREIHLEADAEAFIVRDTGPGISRRDREAVFELGFTRKPGGRG